ncbi:DUF4360 domain-containing protein [Streptomyces albireticuli]|nr:DUF4360 domain-containing protein [Streptomyces albireticuli]
MFTPVLIAGTAAALVAAALSPAPAASGEPPPSGRVFMEIRTVVGHCSSRYMSVAVSPDNTEFTVRSGGLSVRVAAGSKPSDARKNCQMTLDADLPQGYTYAIAGTRYGGFGSLEKGAGGQVKAGNYFQGSPSTTSVSHPFSGPFEGGWEESDVTDERNLVFAPCGEDRLLNLTMALQVDAGTSSPSATGSHLNFGATPDSADTVYRLAWKRCPTT